MWRCGNGHAFDVAREGYVNLLVTHQRRQRDPGDSPDMVHARRAFLDGGWYEPLRTALAGFAPADGGTACDAGCGEGYYTRDWPSLWGVDISKPAVRLAAKRAGGAGTRARYAVASVYDLPLFDASVDVLVSVFAPLHSPEFERVVRPGGRVVTVTPGPDHLDGLARLLFAEVEPHPAGGPFEREGATTALRPEGTTRVSYELEVRGDGAVSALLGMTPYAWYVSPAVREEIAALPSLSTTADFQVSLYRR